MTARLAHTVFRKKKGSANWLTEMLRLAQHKAKMSRRRKDAAHKISNDLVKNHDVNPRDRGRRTIGVSLWGHAAFSVL